MPCYTHPLLTRFVVCNASMHRSLNLLPKNYIYCYTISDREMDAKGRKVVVCDNGTVIYNICWFLDMLRTRFPILL